MWHQSRSVGWYNFSCFRWSHLPKDEQLERSHVCLLKKLHTFPMSGLSWHVRTCLELLSPIFRAKDLWASLSITAAPLSCKTPGLRASLLLLSLQRDGAQVPNKPFTIKQFWNTTCFKVGNGLYSWGQSFYSDSCSWPTKKALATLKTVLDIQTIPHTLLLTHCWNT